MLCCHDPSHIHSEELCSNKINQDTVFLISMCNHQTELYGKVFISLSYCVILQNDHFYVYHLLSLKVPLTVETLLFENLVPLIVTWT